MPSKPKYYWDACAWIALIKREPGRFEACKYVIELAEAGKVEIWTSAFTLAEVFKRRIDANHVYALDEDNDTDFEDYIEKDFVITVQVDVEVGTAARRLLRAHPEVGKPQDAVHVATALLNDIDELHTFDRADLLGLTGVLDRNDGQKLLICPPPAPPPPPAVPPSLFDTLEVQPDESPRNQAEG
ncbi:type II toxin-antitoxin system VapC family toxin [Methylobacterium sp. Leaf85]|uniref:type II toxin-antitoxin system VapC family toxin n=1 Tax=Methylobacterium sp. Leaf85 TaxID=1736241 RepID=UPI00138F0F06|nr:PIN domain-containing protein [Methylobacterium sp. Leaf85]